MSIVNLLALLKLLLIELPNMVRAMQEAKIQHDNKVSHKKIKDAYVAMAIAKTEREKIEAAKAIEDSLNDLVG